MEMHTPVDNGDESEKYTYIINFPYFSSILVALIT